MSLCHTCHEPLPHEKICYVAKNTCHVCHKGFITSIMSDFKDQTIKDYYILIESGVVKNDFCSNVMCDYNDKHTDITSRSKQMRRDK